MSSTRRTIHSLIQLVTANHDVALGRTISAACSCDQSIPSTSAASCDAVNRITPSLIGGQCSSRFHNSTRPVPSQATICRKTVLRPAPR